MDGTSPGELRRMRAALAAAALVRPTFGREAYRVLRYALNLALVRHVQLGDEAVDLSDDRPLLPLLAELHVLGVRHLRQLNPDEAMALAQRHLACIAKCEGWVEERVGRAAMLRETGKAKLAVAVGGGGGTSFISLGAIDLLDGMGIHPALLAGASMGSILASFRARRLAYQVESVIEETAELTTEKVFGVSPLKSHYSIPATLRLTFQRGLGPFFRNEEGFGLAIGDMAIPLRIVVSGVVGTAPHDMDYYQHLLDRSWSGHSVRRLVFNFTRLAAEFVFGSSALKTISLGGDELSAGLNVVDAIGFSSSIPGVTHYDVERHDDDVHRRLTEMMSNHGVSRLIDGGWSQNVPSMTCREAIADGVTGQGHTIVLGLDGFAPNILRQPLWVPAQQLLRGQIAMAREASDHWYAFRAPLSPLQVVPGPKELRSVLQRGREEFAATAAEVQEAIEDPRPAFQRAMRRLTRA